METLPSICPGYDQNNITNTTAFTFEALEATMATNNTSIRYLNKSYASHQVSSFWMDQGTYDFTLTMYNQSDPDAKMSIHFQAQIELTWFMLISIIVVYIVYTVIGVHAVMIKDYYAFKNLVYTGQLIHLVALMARNLPPPFVYFCQRMSIFGMIEGIFSKKFLLGSFNFMTEDNYYLMNYETSSFFANQALSIILILLALAVFVIREVISQFCQKNEKEDKNDIVDVFDSANSKTINLKHLLKMEGPVIHISKRFIFNVFAILYPYLILHALMDIINIDNRGMMKKISFLMGLFFGLAAFKISLVMCAFSYVRYKEQSAKKDIPEETYDNLFSNFSTTNMVRSHVIFWLKRFTLVLLVVISPAFPPYYCIIAGFIHSLVFVSYELDYQATTSKLETLYLILFNGPYIIIAFVSMLMEGTYISYSHKYITSQVMMFLCLLCFLLMIPLRLYDIHKYKPKQMKKRKDISVERLPSSFNQSSTIGLKQKSLSVSEYSEDDYKNDESVVSQEKSSIREESNYEDSPSAVSRPSYNWKKKLGNGNQGDTIGSPSFLQ